MDGCLTLDVIVTVVTIVVDVSSNTQVVGNRRDVIVGEFPFEYVLDQVRT